MATEQTIPVQTSNVTGSSQSTSSSGNFLPMSMTLALLLAMQSIQKYEKNVLDSDAELQKSVALTLGGSQDGKTFSGVGGVLSMLYNAGVLAGAKDADVTRADAYGQIGQAAASGLSLGLSIKSTIGNSGTNSTIKTKLDNIQEMKKTMGNKATLAIGETPQSLTSVSVAERINDMQEGKYTENFKSDNLATQSINEQAAAHIGADPVLREKVMKQLDKQEEALKQEKKDARSSHDEHLNMLSTGSQMVGGAINSGFKMGMQADAQIESAKAKATQGVLNQVEQGLSKQADSMKNGAEAALQQMNQAANNFAQAAANQVHA